MIYKECIDKCFDAVKACDRCSEEDCKISAECAKSHHMTVICSEICLVVGRLTAKGICYKELYEMCAKICDECSAKCCKLEHPHAKCCSEALKACAEACRKCSADCCTKDEQKRKAC